MATTVTASFEKLRQNLEITGLQKSTVSTRQQSVRNVIESDMTVLDSFLTGSYSRSTMIAPLSEADVDIFVVLDSKYFEAGGQAGLLDKVKRVLLKTYTRTPKISRNGHAVTITFDDFVVDVVPAFYRQGGGFLIPNSKQGIWVQTDPKVHVSLMTAENQTHNSDLVPVVKMIKGWNKNIGDGFVSFYLELIAIKIFKGVTISDFQSGMRFYFDKGREAIKLKTIDPAGFGDQINGLRNVTSVADAIKRFETAHSRALRAEAYDRVGNVPLAVEEWIKIFGDRFPVYG